MSNRPEDFPSTPVTKEAHSGLPGVPEDVAERVDNPNFEFDTPLYQKAKELPTPEDLTYKANVRGVEVPTVTPEQLEAAAATVAASRQNQAPEKEKMGLKAKLAWFGAGILTVGGLIGVGANAAAEGPFMKAPTATAPANPNLGGAPLPAVPSGQPTETVPTNNPETNQAISPTDYIFYDEAGTSKSYYDVIDQSRVDPELVQVNSAGAIYKKVEEAVNYLPNEKTVREVLNKPTGDLTMDDYTDVAARYRAVVFGTVLKGKGDLYATLDTIGHETASTLAQTINNGEERYKTSIKYDARSAQIVVTDNSESNSIDDNTAQILGTYQVHTTGSNSDVGTAAVGKDGEKKNTKWINGAARVEKLDTKTQ